MKRVTDNPRPGGGVRIVELAAGGDGLGFLDGQPLFVPGTAPGDLVEPRSLRRSRGVLFALPGRLLEVSPQRCSAPCPWFGSCGGCSWQHLPYPLQLEWKRRLLEGAMVRIGGIADPPVQPVVSSGSTGGWRYRCRLQQRGGRLGFFQRRSHRVVEWGRCLLLPDACNRAVAALRRRLPGGMLAGVESLELAMSPVDGALSLMWLLGREGRSPQASILLELSRESLAEEGLEALSQGVTERRGGKTLYQGPPLRQSAGGVETLSWPGTFFQANPGVNRLLVEGVLSRLLSSGVSSLLELYCGNGNFSLPAAAAGLEVTGVESQERSVLAAREAASGRCRFIHSGVEGFLGEEGMPAAGAVLVDPPRAGLSPPVRRAMGEWRGGPVLYVSCDPATLARDLKEMVSAGYRLREVVPFDMFPHSVHVESLALLEA